MEPSRIDPNPARAVNTHIRVARTIRIDSPGVELQVSESGRNGLGAVSMKVQSPGPSFFRSHQDLLNGFAEMVDSNQVLWEETIKILRSAADAMEMQMPSRIKEKPPEIPPLSRPPSV